MSTTEKLVEMKSMVKQFAHAYALDHVDFDIKKGEVHSLLGENGAGKSTLIKILTGVYPKDGGQIYFEGKPVEVHTREDAVDLGIAVIFQELSLIPTLSVMQNIMLGKEETLFGGVLKKKQMMKEVADLIKRFDFPLNPTDIIEKLSVAQCQMVEILKALSTKASLIIMDEPTSSLSNKESEILFKIINQLRERGVSILYISHRLEEVFNLSDRITVLRDGKLVGVLEKNEIVPTEVIRMMIGKELSEATASRSLCQSDKPIALELKNLTHLGHFEDVSFSLKEGEVLVLTGLVGSGRTEVLRSIFGADGYDSGEILFKGKPLKRGVGVSIRKGFGLIPEDRRKQGFSPLLSVTLNVASTNYDKLSNFALVNAKKEKKLGEDAAALIDLRPRNPTVPVKNLSGGNQQKTVLGKWLTRDLNVLLIDEPTVGIDVGAKDEIYKFIELLSKQNVAILLVSSDISEVLRVATRILIMRNGKIIDEFCDGVVTQEDILLASSGIRFDAEGGATQ